MNLKKLNRNEIICILLLIAFICYSCTVYFSRPTKIINKVEYIKVHDTVFVDTTYIVTHVTLTVYQPVKAQCDGDPFTTSDGSKINLKKLKHGMKWCAISRDLLYLFPKNKEKVIFIEGYGIYKVKDVMNKRFKYSVDLLIHPENSIRIKIKNVKIKILK